MAPWTTLAIYVCSAAVTPRPCPPAINVTCGTPTGIHLGLIAVQLYATHLGLITVQLYVTHLGLIAVQLYITHRRLITV